MEHPPEGLLLKHKRNAVHYKAECTQLSCFVSRSHDHQQEQAVKDRIFSPTLPPGIALTPLTADVKGPRQEGSCSEAASLHCVLVSQTSVKEFLGSKVEESQGEPLEPTTQLGNRLETLCAQDSRQPSITDNTRKGDSFPFNHMIQDGNVCMSVQTLTISLENSQKKLSNVLIQVQEVKLQLQSKPL